MRGRDDAGWYAREIRRFGLRVFAHIARAISRDVAKRTAESAEAAPSGVESDFADRHLRVPQQGLGLLDAAGEQVAMRWQAERFLELASEVRGGDVAHFREALDGPLLVRSGVHAVFRAEQSSQ